MTTLVIGGTGKTGRRVAQRLRDRGVDVRIGSRPAFDWNEPATWSGALDGVGRAYVSFYPDLALPGTAEKIGAFAEAAARHGVKRLVLLSGRGEPEAQRAERALMAAGTEYTIVRCSWFAQNFTEGMLRDAVSTGVLAMPAGEVREPFIDVDDLADVAVEVLTADGHEGRVFEVTGPESLSFADVAAGTSGPWSDDQVLVFGATGLQASDFTTGPATT